MVNDDNKSKQNNINSTFLLLNGFFQEQINKLIRSVKSKTEY